LQLPLGLCKLRGMPAAVSALQTAERSLKAVAREAKLRLLRMHFESGVGHIGGNLSSIDILISLYCGVLKPDDVFVLSKGHSAGAWYTALWSAGALTDDDLLTFHKDGTRLGGHPPLHGIPEIKFATGSLGHGLGLAAGVALGKKLRGLPGRVFCLTSDGEWNEGSCWEALIFAAHNRLSNLILVVDRNGLQGFGSTAEVADIESMASKFRSFGFLTEEIDGHDCEEICRVLRKRTRRPHAIVARTTKGRGVSFMENRMEWHYLPMSHTQYLQAEKEISEACAKPSAGQ
jgi:transketolase